MGWTRGFALGVLCGVSGCAASQATAPKAPSQNPPGWLNDVDQIPPPPVAVERPKARLSVRSPTPVTLHVRKSGSQRATRSHYREICTTPCTVSIPAGTYRMALSSDGSAPAEAAPVKIPAGDYVLEAKLNRMRGRRAGGLVVLLAGGAAGMLVTMAGASGGECGYAEDGSGGSWGGGCGKPSIELMGIGLGFAASSVGLGIWLMTAKDDAQVRLLLGVPAASRPGALLSPSKFERIGAPQGLTLEARF